MSKKTFNVLAEVLRILAALLAGLAGGQVAL